MTHIIRIKILVFFPTGKYFVMTKCDLTFEMCQFIAVSRQVKFSSIIESLSLIDRGNFNLRLKC